MYWKFEKLIQISSQFYRLFFKPYKVQDRKGGKLKKKEWEHSWFFVTMVKELSWLSFCRRKPLQGCQHSSKGTPIRFSIPPRSQHNCSE